MLSRTDIETFCQRIRDRYDPDGIIVFGSYATQRADADSDLDLLVLLPFDGRSLDKSVEMIEALHPPFPIDLIAKREADARRAYDEGHPLYREIFDKGWIVYERERRIAA